MGVLRELGHEAEEVNEVMAGNTPDEVVIGYARERGLILLTRDFDFADIRNYPVGNTPGIVVIHVPDDYGAKEISRLVRRGLGEAKLLAELPGGLAILEPGRVRVRKGC